ncbi:MAG TPA: T9SS type A sorting domain-containing protein [Flavisolibacter sp.]|nr:T9SS type A sorting domain-containing protein [Flavisolibacter sp.]
MRRISTLFASLCLIITNLSAQSGTISTVDPNPVPGWGAPLSVDALNGFSSTNNGPLSLITDFPKNRTTELTSPEYYYTGNQNTIYFHYLLSNANNQATTATPTMKIIYGTPQQVLSYTAPAYSFVKGGGSYYFSFSPGLTLPANTNFRIVLGLTVGNDKTISALSLSTNAILAGSNAPLPLPVKLVKFSGAVNKNKTQLQWLVAENETARNFEVQRSTNGIDFTTAGTISASTKSGDENYNFTENISAERVMYRLKMYDNNFKAEYSKILVFNSSLSTQKSLQVITNPVREKLIISFNNDVNDVAQVTIYDHTGRTIQKQSMNVAAGVNTTTVALNGNYTNGMYIVELATKTTRLSQKVMYSNQ